ncbi:MAG: hypothetical protein ACI90A_000726, partial [Shewanella sp.]
FGMNHLVSSQAKLLSLLVENGAHLIPSLHMRQRFFL